MRYDLEPDHRAKRDGCHHEEGAQRDQGNDLTDLTAKPREGERSLLDVGITRSLERLILFVEAGARLT